MDALDLSLGEKRSRRKTNMPMRRQAMEKAIGAEGGRNVADQEEKSPTENGDFPEEANNLEPKTILLKQDLNETEPFEERDNSFPSRNNDSVKSYCSTPSDEGKDAIERSLEGNNTPSSIESDSRNHMPSPSESAISYHGNVNNNNSNPLVSLTRFPQLQSNPSIPNLSIPQADLTALQERFASFNSANSQSTIGPGMKSPRIPYSPYDVQPIDTPGIPERTKKQNRWAFNVWREWARKRNLTGGSSNENVAKVPLDVGQASEGELDYWLSKFVQEIRRKDGNPYPPHTLMQIVMGIQRYLRQQAGRPSICILDRSNPIYGRFRSVLDNRIKELTTEGVTASHKAGRRSSLPSSSSASGGSSNHNVCGNSVGNYPEQSVLWSAGIIGNDSALGLLNAVFYHNTVTFGIRNIDDHWNLKMSHFVLGNRGQQSQAFIEFAPSNDPVYANRGMTEDRRIYAEPNNSRCVVKIFQKYMSLVPPDGPFYRHPQEPTLVDKSIRFSDQWVGKNRLRAMIKHIFDSTRLDGKERGLSSLTTAATNSNTSRYGTNAPNPSNTNIDSNAAQASVYDRLAQVMMQLSYMSSSSPHIRALPTSSSSPLLPSTHSPKPEVGEYDARPLTQVMPGRNEIVLKRESSPDSLLGASQPKRIKTEQDDDNRAEEKFEQETDNVSDDVKVTSSSCEKHIDDNMLEIAVPSNIEAVTVIKGSKKITIQLD